VFIMAGVVDASIAQPMGHLEQIDSHSPEMAEAPALDRGRCLLWSNKCKTPACNRKKILLIRRLLRSR
jgi:hypothetical protein